MSERQLHLVRHGEVDNPTGVLYGRIPGYGLSDLGGNMAGLAAAELAARGRRYGALLASPLQRAQESARPLSAALELPVETEPRVIEPTNKFEGMQTSGPNSALKRPRNWLYLYNPLRPSWGEPYRSILRRMRAAMDDAWDARAEDDADTVIVSHQSPIVMVQRYANGRPLTHDPRKRRCDLSSITSLVRDDSGRWRQVGYVSPAAPLLARAVDVGAV